MKQIFITLKNPKAWLAESPNLPGCVCMGATQEEAVERICCKIRAYRDDLNWEGQSELLIVAY